MGSVCYPFLLCNILSAVLILDVKPLLSATSEENVDSAISLDGQCVLSLFWMKYCECFLLFWMGIILCPFF
jgi:hypothetical protein